MHDSESCLRSKTTRHKSSRRVGQSGSGRGRVFRRVSWASLGSDLCLAVSEQH